MKPHPESAREALDWQAFRFIANEMSLQEQSDFERLLADDQSAREAVASAVELTQTIYAAELFSTPRKASTAAVSTSATSTAAVPFSIAHSRSQYWLAPIGWLSVGAVACLVLVLSILQFAPRTTTEIAHQGKASVELAEVWSAQTLNASEVEFEEPALDIPVSWKEEQELETPLAENHAPTWMLEAVRNESPDAADEEMES